MISELQSKPFPSAGIIWLEEAKFQPALSVGSIPHLRLQGLAVQITNHMWFAYQMFTIGPCQYDDCASWWKTIMKVHAPGGRLYMYCICFEDISLSKTDVARASSRMTAKLYWENIWKQTRLFHNHSLNESKCISLFSDCSLWPTLQQ